MNAIVVSRQLVSLGISDIRLRKIQFKEIYFSIQRVVKDCLFTGISNIAGQHYTNIPAQRMSGPCDIDDLTDL